MAKMSSSADYFLRDSERFCRETSNIVRRNDNEGFAMPNLTRGLRCRNTFKSRLLCSTSEKSQIHEEVHSIGYGVDGIEDFNAPTTSTATCQQKQFSSIMNSFHDRLSSTDIRYNQNECRNRLFRPALQKSAFNSRLEECNQDYNLGKSVDDMSITKKFGLGLRNSTTNTSNIFKDKVSFYHNQNYTSNNDSVASRKFNLEMRSNSLEKGMCNSNPGRFNPDLNVKTSTKATFPRMFGQQSKNVALETFTLLEDSTRSSLVENFRSNSQINMPTTSKTFGSEARKSLFGGGTLICDKKKYNEIQYDNEGFVRPTIPRAIRPRNSIMSSRLFTGNNFGQYNKDLSSASVFNVTHIPRRDLDLYSDSRQFSLRQNSVDSLSIAGSVASIATAKAQFINVLESLHHSILNMAPNLPIEAVRKEFDHAKEVCIIYIYIYI